MRVDLGGHAIGLRQAHQERARGCRHHTHHEDDVRKETSRMSRIVFVSLSCRQGTHPGVTVSLVFAYPSRAAGTG